MIVSGTKFFILGFEYLLNFLIFIEFHRHTMDFFFYAHLVSYNSPNWPIGSISFSVNSLEHSLWTNILPGCTSSFLLGMAISFLAFLKRLALPVPCRVRVGGAGTPPWYQS